MEDFESLTEKLARITIERDRLREENCRLREQLGQASGIDGSVASEDRRLLPKEFDSVAEDLPPAPVKICKTGLSIPEKISLFRSLFRGREDMYAVRFETANGKSGYSPACRRDWDALRSLSKSEWKKRDRETRQLLSLTDQAIHDHLTGRITVGIYPLLVDEACWFLAVDFDQETWREDALAFMESCREWNVPAALERSRSGDGAHVWIFFASSIPATLARRLGAAALTRTMERRHHSGCARTIAFFRIRTPCLRVDSGI